MKKYIPKIGYAPTRRDCFTHPDANVMRTQIFEKIINWEAELIDIDDVTDEGFLMNPMDIDKVAEKFYQAGVDGIFVPHCNFGSESIVARLAAKLNKPVLLWGPRDDEPQAGVDRTRDSQCGLFATGKILRRMNVPFTYIVNSGVNDPVFERGYKSFVAVCSVVKSFRTTRVLQIDVRPEPFWSVIYNESEILEKYGIQVYPITLQDLKDCMDSLSKNRKTDVDNEVMKIKSEVVSDDVNDEMFIKLATLKIAIREICSENYCNSVAIQCWEPLHKAVGVAACTVNGLLTEEGIPVACETDVLGAVTSIMLQAAALHASSIFFADLTIRHPNNDNAELLWHCGNFPPSLACKPGSCKVKCLNQSLGPIPSQNHCEIKHGDITVCRFDGDHGNYQLFIGEGRGVDGPQTTGTYSWFETNDWAMWEEKLVTGPYIHHCAGIHAKVAPILYEACKYLGIKPDPASPTEDEIMAYWRGKDLERQ